MTETAVKKAPAKKSATSQNKYIKNQKVKIEWWKKNCSLCEGVSSGIELAFCSEDKKQCHDFVHCKDYLQDAIQATVLKTTKSVYGFTFNPKFNPPVCLTKTYMLIGNFQDANFAEKLPGLIDFLHQIEKKLGLIRTTVQACQDPPKQHLKSGTWLLTSSKRWMHAPPMISLYNLLIRVGMNHKVGTDYMATIDGVLAGSIPAYQSADKYYLSSAKKGIDTIMSKGIRKVFLPKISQNFPSKIAIGSMHSSSGIVAFSNGSAKSIMPDWYKD